MKRDVVAALIHRNAEEFVAHQEWEWEWNHAGLASRLTEEVGAVPFAVCASSEGQVTEQHLIPGWLDVFVD